MGHDLAKLFSKGRAYSAAREWTGEELDAWLLLQRECNLNRETAAEYVRNGIMTKEAFDKATKSKFKPKTLEEAHSDAENKLKERGKKVTRKVGSKKK